MLELCKTILDIALWRRGPQDLPASGFLVVMLFVVYLAVGLLQVLLGHFPVRTLLALSSLEVLMWSLWLGFVLTLFQRRARFVQTLAALLGVNVLLDLVRLTLHAMMPVLAPTQEAQVMWLFMLITALVLIMGRILMHATDQGLASGIALSIAIVFSTNAVANLLTARM
jgi:hypothetical protein